MNTAGPIVLASGGTGGHVIPARALADALIARGWKIALVTDGRGLAFGDNDANTEIHQVKAASLGGGACNKLKGLTQLGVGLLQARALLQRLKASAVVGFGGYPSVPTMWVAACKGLPTIIHEQNAVLGRANRLLAPRVGRIATSFATVERIRPADTAKIVFTGTPVRAPVTAIRETPYPAPESATAPLHVLVFGGSQGARVLSDVVPEALAALDDSIKNRLVLTQQCREEDIERVRSAYDKAGITATLATFFDDMPERLAAAQLVIARSGASTIAELTVAGRPAILVPYRYATDDHQTANARAVERAGAGWLIAEQNFTPQALANRLSDILTAPDILAQAASNAAQLGITDAAERLADLTEALSANRDPAKPREAAA
jgi:UDP-N-acetylglucosamine--N-acetylmuramyl-(pentapeptide) pyrophosphoryl-undecaprenol N-acetylglucosamine transferase